MVEEKRYFVAPYKRLSREDGDRPESDSIVNQQYVLEDFCSRHPEFVIADDYADDGYTGTNFDRPDFKRMIADIEAGKVNCVVVKDLSRFGRDYIDMGYYLERYFPAHGVRFIAVNDGVDSADGPYDMLLPLKNVFNTQYAKDISGKVRSAFRAKQRRGEFIGAFASYGYLKSPENHNRLVVDPVAAAVVRRVFTLAAQGVGQLKIAKGLNEENIPCPSEYKRLMGERYRNCRKLDATTYWTYATVHRMLHNRMYLGDMVQGRSIRPTMHGKAKQAEESQWTVVEQTHQAIISQELWDSVQAQLSKHTRMLDFEQNVGLLAGFLKCGDCGRSMVKTVRSGRTYYSCGSYKRYGPTACSKHTVIQSGLEAVLLGDLNRIIASVQDLRVFSGEGDDSKKGRQKGERERLTGALERVRGLKQGAYEDYRDKLLSREDFLRYQADYDKQEQVLVRQLAQAEDQSLQQQVERLWVQRLLELGRLTELDRITVAQTVKEIRIFEENKIEITYLFSGELQFLLESGGESEK